MGDKELVMTVTEMVTGLGEIDAAIIERMSHNRYLEADKLNEAREAVQKAVTALVNIK